ncbi:MAG: potassium channel protein, partial [Calditrichaeota bacterium]
SLMHQRESLYLNFVFILVGLLSLSLLGVLGYGWIEGLDWFQALYQTIITFSTVGFHEVRPLSPAGRVFTIFLIFSGLVIIALLSGSVTTWFVSAQILTKRKELKMKKKIAALKDHVIICGGGETAKTVIKEFSQAGKPFVVVEQNAETVRELQETFADLLIIEGDATKDEVLAEARIEAAHGLITTMPVDADNLFVVVSARSLNPNLVLISRAVDPHTESKLYRAGANYVIVPNVLEGIRMASVLLRPTLISFLEVMISNTDMSLRLEEVGVPEQSSLVEKTLGEAHIPQRTGLIVIALKRAQDSKWIFNPRSTTILHKNDRLIVLGDQQRIAHLHELIKE